MNLVVDIGNTTVKAAVFAGKEMVDYKREDGQDVSILKEMVDKYDIDYVKPDIKQPHYAHYPNPAHSKWQKRQQA